MKIVNRKTFLELPAETLFTSFRPNVFSGLDIKCCDPGAWGNDYLYDELIAAIENSGSDDWNEKINLMEKGQSVASDFEYTARDGLFEEDAQYLIYEKEDVQKLINRLTKCL